MFIKITSIWVGRSIICSLCDLLDINKLTSEDPIYDREIESYLINEINMGNLSEITG